MRMSVSKVNATRRNRGCIYCAKKEIYNEGGVRSKKARLKMRRLDYDDILQMYKCISLNYTARQIARKLHVSPSTVYRLIEKNLEIRRKKPDFVSARYRDCQHIAICQRKVRECPPACAGFQSFLCPKLRRFPFLCDFCEAKSYCGKERHFWNPVEVYGKRIQRGKEARKRLSLSEKRRTAFDGWITPLIRQRLSIEAIHSQHPESFPVSPSTVRRWIDAGRLTARRIDLLRAVAFRSRKPYERRRPSDQDPLAKFEHTYQYFLDHLQAHPLASVIEMDTVHGLKTEQRKLLTFYHRQSHLQFGVLIPNLFPSSVRKVLAQLHDLLGNHFSLLFEVILADNGPEFDELIPGSVDSVTGEVLSRVFYTRPYRSGDKGGCERNHELFRYLVPKGHGLADLMQEDINFMFSKINSYPRESLNWKTPIDVFKQSFPREILDKLQIRLIPLDEINLKG